MEKDSQITINNINDSKSIINKTENDTDNNSNSDRQAFYLERKAERKLNPGCCLDTLFSSKTKRYNEACDLYKKAGDKYKLSNEWRKAAACYDNCSKIKIKLKENPLEYYQASFFCYSKANSDSNSKNIFIKMNQYLEKEGEFYQIGKNNEQMGVKKENNENYNEAIDYYSEAIKYYEMDGKHESLKNNMQIKTAELMMIHNHPDAPSKVPTILENIGNDYLKNPISKYSAKDFFGKAILSIIYYKDDPSEGRKYINKFKQADQTFEESTIYTLCCDLVDSIENNSINKLQSSIQNYKEISEVDEFMANILDKLVEKTKKKDINGFNNNMNFEEEDLK